MDIASKEDCQYSDGTQIVLPSVSSPSFSSDQSKQFSLEKGYFFDVLFRVVDAEGMVSRGKWKRVVNAVDGKVEFDFVKSEWNCFRDTEQPGRGYYVCQFHYSFFIFHFSFFIFHSFSCDFLHSKLF